CYIVVIDRTLPSVKLAVGTALPQSKPLSDSLFRTTLQILKLLFSIACALFAQIIALCDDLRRFFSIASAFLAQNNRGGGHSFIPSIQRNYIAPMTRLTRISLWFLTLALAPITLPLLAQQTPINLPNGRILAEVPGHPRSVNNLPTAAALSPDKKFAVFLHSGY